MPYLSIPENFYAVVDADTKVVLPDIITCMGICITASDNRKVIAHCADMPGYPVRKTNEKMHPLPYDHLAMEEFSSSIFEFLLEQLNISKADIKEVKIFGYYRKRVDIFETQENDGVSDDDVRQVISSQFNITPKQVHLNPLRKVNYGVNPDGSVVALPEFEDLIADIEFENVLFHERNANTPFKMSTLEMNHRMFRTKAEKIYAKDDLVLNDFSSSELIFK